MHDDVAQLYDALFDLIRLLNRPERDALLAAEANVTIDRALFPLLMRIAYRGPMAIGALAGHVGRDHTTVSRQAAKLVQLGLVERQPRPADRRVTEVRVTDAGGRLAGELTAARERLA